MNEGVLQHALKRLAPANARLLARAKRTSGESADAVLNLGAGIVFLNQMTNCLVGSLESLLDEAVQQQLAADERDLAENLDHLDVLCDTEPDSADIAALATALVERMREHLERKDRVVFRLLKHLDSLPQGAGAEAKLREGNGPDGP